MSKTGYDFLTATDSPIFFGGQWDNLYLSIDKSKYLTSASNWSTTDLDPSNWDWPYKVNLSFTADSGKTTLNYKNFQTSSDSSTDSGYSYSNTCDASINFKSKLGDSIFRSDVNSSSMAWDINGNSTAFKSNRVDEISYKNTKGTTTTVDDFSAAGTWVQTQLQTNDPVDSNKYSIFHTADFNYKAADNKYSLSLIETYKQTLGIDTSQPTVAHDPNSNHNFQDHTISATNTGTDLFNFTSFVTGFSVSADIKTIENEITGQLELTLNKLVIKNPDYEISNLTTHFTREQVNKIDVGMKSFDYSGIENSIMTNFLPVVLTESNKIKIINNKGVTFDAGTGDDQVIGGTGKDTLSGGTGNDALNGGIGDDSIFGGVGNDDLTGGAGNDTLDGGLGFNCADYTTEKNNLKIDLKAGSATGLDKLGIAAIGVDKLVSIQEACAGSGNDVLIGASTVSSQLEGGAGNDTLTGGSSADTLIGGAGSDILDGGAGIDTADYSNETKSIVAVLMGSTTSIIKVDGNNNDSIVNFENLVGGAGDDKLTGDGNNNILNGGAGNDTLIGGAGNDTYVVDNTGDKVYDVSAPGQLADAGGVDTVKSSVNYSLGNFIENLTLTGTVGLIGLGNELANIITGTSANDTLNGAAGNDTLIGGAGNDSLTGGAGIDSFTVDSGTDTITDLGVGGADILTVSANATANATIGAAWTATSFSINNGTAVLSTAGYAVDLSVVTSGHGFTVTDTGAATTLTGSSGNDNLIGGAGNDTLIGGLGNDLLTGGSGVDTFNVTSGTDVISDLGLGGTDILTVASGATASAALGAAWTATSVSINYGTELLTSAGYSVDLTAITKGNGFSISNTGNAASSFTGSGLADSITGGSGNDVLIGGAGNDTLVGGTGNDLLTGGAGSDLFVFNSLLSSNKITNIDTIIDFVTGQDKIQLNTSIFKAIGTGTTLADSALYAGTAAHAATDRIIYNKATGALLYDDDGNGRHAAVQFATLGTTTHPDQLLASDFVVHG